MKRLVKPFRETKPIPKPKLRKGEKEPILIGMAERLVLTRKRAGMTQKEFSAALEIEIPHLKALERATYGMKPEFLVKWKTEFRVSYEWILEGE